jgi:hypothetical protein
MGSAARMVFYLVPAALLCMLYGDSEEQPGRAAYRTAPESGSLIMKRLEIDALTSSEVPPELRNKLRYFDFDTNGFLESRISWDNLYGPDAYLLIERDGRNKVVFPELSKNAIRPDEKPPALSLDYHYIDATGKTESIMYAMGRDLYSGFPLDFGRRPVIVERQKDKYYWRDIPQSTPGGSTQHMKTRPASPIPSLHRSRANLAGR